jgi:SAM-dependent methyltransferase
MYEKLKSALRRFVPQSLLIRYEAAFRMLFYQFYRGNKYQCNICGRNLRNFIVLNDDEKMCPSCGSLARNRRLWHLLHQEFLQEGKRILDFSPSRSLYKLLKKKAKIDYISSDFAGEFIADRQYDITHIPEPDESFDLIICYHILEHIEEDEKALKEVYRILKKGGHCLIQTPFKEGEIYENSAFRTPEERAQHFGQADHVRIYSAQGLRDRLSACGFTSELREFHEVVNNTSGFQIQEQLIVAIK